MNINSPEDNLHYDHDERFSLEDREETMIDLAYEVAEEGMYLFFILIPENIDSTERYYKYEKPLIEALNKDDLGDVIGCGSQIGDHSEIEYCGIEVIVSNPVKGLQIVVEIMKNQQSPRDTEIQEYLPARRGHRVWFGA